MFRLYNVNNPEKLAELAKNCKGNVEVEFAGEALNMKEANAKTKAMEMLKKGIRNIVVVLDNKKDLRAYTTTCLLH